MKIDLPDELEHAIRPLVLSGQFASEQDVVAEALREFLQRHSISQAAPSTKRSVTDTQATEEAGTSIGLFRDDPELMDQIVRQVMEDRQRLPLRAEDHE